MLTPSPLVKAQLVSYHALAAAQLFTAATSVLSSVK